MKLENISEEPEGDLEHDDLDLPSMDEDLPDLPLALDSVAEETEKTEIEPSTGQQTSNDGGARPSSQEFKDKLSAKIETIITETVQSTLHDLLPDVVEEIIHDEYSDK